MTAIDTPDGHPPVRILLVDIHAISRSSSRAMLDAMPTLTVVGETSSHAEAMQMAAVLEPDVVLVGMRVQGSSGPDTSRALIKAFPGLRVVFLTLFYEPEYVQSAIAAGAHGYVLKHEPAAQVLKAIDTVMHGGTYFSPGLQMPP